MAASLYSQDLHGRRVRVLDLSSVLPGEKDSLQGNLRVVSLDKKFKTPTFEALSYVWGDDANSPSRHLTCSGVDIPITQNCYDAIRTLHRHFGVRTIWIDAICINQDNAEEKEHQIPLMRDIFGKARRVFVWLGNATPESDYAFDWIARESAFTTVLVAARFKAFPALMLPSEILRAARLVPLFIRKWRLRLLKPLPYREDAMHDIIQRPWFRRVWTVQELVMANEPIIVCGTKTLTWNDLHWGITRWGDIPGSRCNRAFRDTLSSSLTVQSFWIDRYQKYLQTEIVTRTWFPGDGLKHRLWQRLLDFLAARDMMFDKVQTGMLVTIIAVRLLLGKRPLNSLSLLFVLISTLITKIITPGGHFPPHGSMAPWEIAFREKIVTILSWVRSREATHPVDKVFALYGLFEDFGMPLQRPDYSKSTGQVYLEFTCALIQWHKSLALLTETSPPGVQGLPTWVPDWNKRHERVSTCKKKAAKESTPSFVIVGGAYDCSGVCCHNREDFEWTPETTRNDPSNVPKIITKGFIEDKIAFCLPQFREDNEQKRIVDLEKEEMSERVSPILLHNTGIMLQWLAIFQQPHLHNESSPSSIFEELFEILHSEVWQHFSHREQLKEIFPYWLALLNTYLPLSSTEEPTSSVVALCARRLQQDDKLYSYHRERCNAIAGKRIFFTTEKGRPGTGLKNLTSGDEIALLAGLSSPMVLKAREQNNEYEVKGAVYVQGMMQGEAWPDNDEKVGELVLV